MIDLTREAESLHSDLVERQVVLTKDAINRVLIYLEDEVPEILEDGVYTESRKHLLDALAEFADYQDKGDLISVLVAGRMAKSGVIRKYIFPEDLNLPQEVLDKMTILRPEFQQHNSTVAFIILNSSNAHEVRQKIRGARYSCDETQLLLPMFWELCKIDKSVEKKLLSSLRDHPITAYFTDRTEVVLRNYCFDWGSQPYGTLVVNYPQIPSEMRKSLFNALIASLLKILQEYLRG